MARESFYKDYDIVFIEKLNGIERKCVMARDIHSILKIKLYYSTWFNNKVRSVAAKSPDFDQKSNIAILEVPSYGEKGRPKSDAIISIETAIEFCKREHSRESIRLYEYLVRCRETNTSQTIRIADIDQQKTHTKDRQLCENNDISTILSDITIVISTLENQCSLVNRTLESLKHKIEEIKHSNLSKQLDI